MMKTVSAQYFVLFFCLISFTVITCKKDYPDDTPQWIKDQIKECKRTHSCCGSGSGPYLINEYNWKDSVTVYYFGISDGQYAFYDINGNKICFYINGLTDCLPSYPDLKNFTNLTLIRKIWKQDMDKCR